VKLSKYKEMKLWLKVFRRNLKFENYTWKKLNYSSPSPQHVKIKILKSNSLPNATWIETGTYLGDTTSKLSKISRKVISIEPQLELSLFAAKRLGRHENVRVINATSESIIAKVLEDLSGPTCFWLDGHYSGDVTYQGAEISPISTELSVISNYLRNNKVVVFIDDFRLFVNSAATGYPTQSSLITWSENNNLLWTVEHDIFIAKSR